MRWCRVKLAARLGRASIRLSYVDDTTIAVDPRQPDSRVWAYWALAEFEDMAFALHVLRKDDVFVDVGGNVGAYTLLAAGGCGASVLVAEPDAANFKALGHNVERNALGNRVEAVCAALGAAAGVVDFNANGSSGAHVLRAGDAAAGGVAADRVRVVRLDDWVGERVVTLVKIDTEGYELAVIEGASRVLSPAGALAAIVEVNSSGAYFGSSDESVHGAMTARGYQACAYDPASRTVTPIEAGWNRRRGNTIYVRDLAEVRRRCTSAPRHRALGVHI